MLRRSRRPVLDGRSLHLGPVVADDGIWQLVRGSLGPDRVAVTVRRPARPSAAAGPLLVAEHDLLTRLGGGVVAEPVALVAPSPTAPPTALVLRPAVVATVGAVGRLTVGQVAGVVATAAEALTRLHGAGVVHTDLHADALGVDQAGAVVLVSVARARRRRPSGDEGATDDVVALGELGLGLLASAEGASTEREAVAAVLGRLVDPDPLRRPDARTALEVLRRTGPPPRPLPVPDPPASDPVPPSTGGWAVPAPEPAPTNPPRTDAPPADAPRADPPPADAPREDPPRADASPADPPRADPPPADAPGSRRRYPVATRRRPATGTAVLACVASMLVAVGVNRLTTGGLPDPAGVDGRARSGVAPGACPVAGAPSPAADAVTVQADVDGRGCTVAVVWSPSLGEVAVAAPEGVRRYGLGQPGDELVVADWDCDGAATPLLRRPTDGEAWRFDRWPTDERPVEPTPVPVDLTPPTC